MSYEYVDEYQPVAGPVGNPDQLSAFFWGALFGTLFIAPFIWTGLGREMAYKSAAKAYGISKAKLESKIRRKLGD